MVRVSGVKSSRVAELRLLLNIGSSSVGLKVEPAHLLRHCSDSRRQRPYPEGTVSAAWRSPACDGFDPRVAVLEARVGVRAESQVSE